MYFETFSQMKKHLVQLDAWLDAAQSSATARSFDSKLFLGFRIAPDQFAFARQVQITCDTAKLGASRLSGKEAPVQPDTEQTLEDLKARVRSVIDYLGSFTKSDFDPGAVSSRVITQPRWEGRVMSGADYFMEHCLPNFFFHLTHAYAILRHNGVSVGKKDYLGALTQRTP